MNLERLIVGVVLGLAALGVGVWALSGQTVGGYYKTEEDGKTIAVQRDVIVKFLDDVENNPDLSEEQKQARWKQTGYTLSWPRTLGIWLAAFLTLAMLSFLYRDNPIYKFAEHLFVGVSAAYWMVVAFWTVVVPNMFGKLAPFWTKFTFMPGLDIDEIAEKFDINDADGLTASWLSMTDLRYWVPVVLGVMLLWRLAPKGAWIARWPLAFILGTTAGLRLVAFLESDFIAQINATILPLFDPVYDPQSGAMHLGLTLYQSTKNFLIVGGVLCGLVYFFFSLEHKGLVGRVSRMGIWVLMITFGAGFGYTVMGRIALLVGRLEFLFGNWLNVIPP